MRDIELNYLLVTNVISTVRHRQAVIFDFDDTLIATNAFRKPLFLRFLQLFSDLPPDALDEVWGRPMLEMLACLAPDIDSERALEIYRVIMELGPPAPLLPGADSALRFLAKSEVPLLILTSSARSLVESDLSRHDLVQLFTKIWSSDDIPYPKPDPRVISPLVTWLNENELDLEETLYIGDSLLDYELAKQTGIPFLAVTTGAIDREAFLAAGCIDVIEDLQQLVHCPTMDGYENE